LGAAACAVGIPYQIAFVSLSRHWPILDVLVPAEEIPVEIVGACRQLNWVIMSLNDVARWSRTQIADWVEQFEERHLEVNVKVCIRDEALGSLTSYTVSSNEPDDEAPILFGI
jgi:hypothetical protein